MDSMSIDVDDDEPADDRRALQIWCNGQNRTNQNRTINRTTSYRQAGRLVVERNRLCVRHLLHKEAWE